MTGCEKPSGRRRKPLRSRHVISARRRSMIAVEVATEVNYRKRRSADSGSPRRT